MLTGVFVLVLAVYWSLELHYFLRILFCYLHSKFGKKRLDILDESSYSSICLTTDIDILLFHMNNARFLREVDFARTDFYNRTHLWRKIREKGGEIYQGATTIRYRRFIKLFTQYRITSKVVYWDHDSIYMEHRFVTKHDKFVRAIVYGKQKVVKCSVEQVMAELMKNPPANAKNKLTGQVRQKPPCPMEIRLWIESSHVSSNKLRENIV